MAWTLRLWPGKLLPGKRWPVAPIDRAYGIATSSYMRKWRLRSGDAAIDAANVGYVGCQPSVVRRALAKIPAIDQTAFADLGCGKGRTLAVATETGFRRITGIEIAPALARIAQRNMAIIARQHPERTPVAIIVGNAVDLRPLDGGDLILFVYNSFRRPLIADLLIAIDDWLARNPAHRLYIVYYNCVQFDMFDAADTLERFSVEQIGFDAEELATRPHDNSSEAVAIYRARGRDAVPTCDDADAHIIVTIPDYGAKVVAGSEYLP